MHPSPSRRCRGLAKRVRAPLLGPWLAGQAHSSAASVRLPGGGLRREERVIAEDGSINLPPGMISCSISPRSDRQSRRGPGLSAADLCQLVADVSESPGEELVEAVTEQRTLRAFAAFDVPCRWVNDPDVRGGTKALGADRDWVAISTIASAKGLEFLYVLLCGYLEVRPPRQDEVLNRRLVYVGMTRAIHQLVLTASGKHPYIADLEIH
jgi:hypothetical protein